MYRLLLFIFLITLFSCNFNRNNNGEAKGVEAGQEGDIDADRLASMKFDYAIDYDDALALLDKGDLRSIELAIAIFNNSTPDSLARESASGDSMFVSLNDFMVSSIQSYAEINLNENQDLKRKLQNGEADAEIAEFKEPLELYGISLSASEGEYYLEANQNYLSQKLEGHLSKASSGFLRMKIREQENPLQTDGALLLPPDSITNRLVAWEDFILLNPGYISISEAEVLYSTYLSALLAGTDNTPVFDLDTKKIDERFKAAYEIFTVAYPERKSAKVVKQYYDLISANGFKYSDKIGDFLMENVTQ